MKRLFIAAPIAPTNKTFFERVVTKFQSALAPDAHIKWSEPNHITFHFLGNVEPASEEKIREILKSLSWDAFFLRLDCLEVFPTKTEGRVLVVTSSIIPKAAHDLHANIGNFLRLLGFPEGNRTFIPHLTFGRLGRKAKVEVPLLTDTLSILIDRICLFQSHLEPSGSRYEILETWKGRV